MYDCAKFCSLLSREASLYESFWRRRSNDIVKWMTNNEPVNEQVSATSPPPILNFPRNPDYGHGITRRLVRLVGTPGQVQAVLTDIFHEMRCTVSHDGETVAGIHGEMVRFPTTACPAAASVLEEMCGLPIDTPMVNLYAGGRPARNCTHLFDLATLAVAHSRRGTAVRVYSAAVPDETDGPVEITASCNGKIVHCWSIRNGIIEAPRELAGRPLRKGFASWAVETFEDTALEAATVLSRTYFIAYGARFLHEAADGLPVATQAARLGVCYAFAVERASLATFRKGNRRDFTNGVVETLWQGVSDDTTGRTEE